MPNLGAPGATSNPYNNRFRWWYPAIADWMIANPGRPLLDCAKEIGRGYSTICLIVNSDMFQSYFAQRRKEFQNNQDDALRQKVHRVADASLDILLESLEKKRDQVPVDTLAAISTSALDRLGYSPKAQQSGVNLSVNAPNGQVNVLVSASELEEARNCMRIAQGKRAEEPPKSHFLPPAPHEDIVEAEFEDAPLTISPE